ncbi:pyrroloquinoline quinone precursor peptide PqqA [Streptomyces sp. NPDC048415]|jgi:coenzyme PQQ precursor peptide PqqA
MNETEAQTKAVEAAPSQQPDPTAWQTPEYTVVDTALEVTAYSLNSR